MPLRTDFTKALPFEVVLEVVSHLDTGSIVAFLDAFPHMKKYAICDFLHSDLPMFFDVDGVPRLPAMCSHEFFVKQSSLRPIRLVEFHDRVVQYWPTNRFFGKTTFMFCLSSQSSDPSQLHRTGRLFEAYGCKWRVGLRARFSANGSYSKHQLPPVGPVFNGPLTCKQSIDYSSLVTLRLEDVPLLQGLAFPVMRELSLIYGASTTARPTITSIDAPKITRFVIHFQGDCLPRISGLSVGYNRDPCTKKWAKNYPVNEPPTFELADSRFIDCGSESTLGQASLSTLDPGRTTDCDMRFVETFTSLNWIGVPLSLLECVSFNQLSRLYLRLACAEYCRLAKGSLAMPSLQSVLVHAIKTGCEVPVLQAPLLSSLSLFVYAPGVGFSNIGKFGANSGHFRQLQMYFHPRILRDLEPAAYSIDHRTWNDGGLSTMLQGASHISIVGAEMPFLTDSTEHGAQSSKVRLRDRYATLRLEPLLTPTQLREKCIRIDALSVEEPCDWGSGHLFAFFIVPILRSSEALPPGGASLYFPGLTIARHPGHKSEHFASILTGAYFRKCVVGDTTLTVPACERLRKTGLVSWRSDHTLDEDGPVQWEPFESLPNSAGR